MGELMDGYRCPRGAIFIKIFAVHLVVAAEVIHVHQIGGDLHHILQAGANRREDIANVFNDRLRLDPDVQAGGAHLIHLHPLESIVRTAAARAGDKQEIARSFDMREFTPRPGLAGDDFAFNGKGGFFGHGWWLSHQR